MTTRVSIEFGPNEAQQVITGTRERTTDCHWIQFYLWARKIIILSYWIQYYPSSSPSFSILIWTRAEKLYEPAQKYLQFIFIIRTPAVVHHHIFLSPTTDQTLTTRSAAGVFTSWCLIYFPNLKRTQPAESYLEWYRKYRYSELEGRKNVTECIHWWA